MKYLVIPVMPETRISRKRVVALALTSELCTQILSAGKLLEQYQAELELIALTVELPNKPPHLILTTGPGEWVNNATGDEIQVFDTNPLAKASKTILVKKAHCIVEHLGCWFNFMFEVDPAFGNREDVWFESLFTDYSVFEDV